MLSEKVSIIDKKTLIPLGIVVVVAITIFQFGIAIGTIKEKIDGVISRIDLVEAKQDDLPTRNEFEILIKQIDIINKNIQELMKR